jgi:hypothetical protein
MYMKTGRPPTTVLFCRSIHAFLLEQGIPVDRKIPRPLWDELLARAGQVGYNQAHNMTKTGATHGLWEFTPGQGRLPGSVKLLQLEMDADLLDDGPSRADIQNVA